MVTVLSPIAAKVLFRDAERERLSNGVICKMILFSGPETHTHTHTHTHTYTHIHTHTHTRASRLFTSLAAILK